MWSCNKCVVFVVAWQLYFVCKLETSPLVYSRTAKMKEHQQEQSEDNQTVSSGDQHQTQAHELQIDDQLEHQEHAQEQRSLALHQSQHQKYLTDVSEHRGSQHEGEISLETQIPTPLQNESKGTNSGLQQLNQSTNIFAPESRNAGTTRKRIYDDQPYDYNPHNEPFVVPVDFIFPNKSSPYVLRRVNISGIPTEGESRTFLKAALGLLSGLNIGGHSENTGYNLPTSGQFSATNTMSFLGKIFNTAFTISYGTPTHKHSIQYPHTTQVTHSPHAHTIADHNYLSQTGQQRPEGYIPFPPFGSPQNFGISHNQLNPQDHHQQQHFQPQPFEHLKHQSPQHAQHFYQPQHAQHFDQPQHGQTFDQPQQGCPCDQPQHGQPYDQPQHAQDFGQPQHGQTFDQPQQGCPCDRPQHGQAYDQPQHGQPYDQPQFEQPGHQYLEHDLSRQDHHTGVSSTEGGDWLGHRNDVHHEEELIKKSSDDVSDTKHQSGSMSDNSRTEHDSGTSSGEASVYSDEYTDEGSFSEEDVSRRRSSGRVAIKTTPPPVDDGSEDNVEDSSEERQSRTAGEGGATSGRHSTHTSNSAISNIADRISESDNTVIAH